ncbi:MAG: methyltransferase domain-containing protein [Candidatus Levyibacteriota bacterium]
MEIANLSTNYSKHASRNPLQRLLINNFYSELLSIAKSLEPVSILDAGCGEGFTLVKLIENGIGKKLEGVEYSEIAIKLSKKINPHLNIRFGTVYELPYKDNSFDLVLCTEVLEHLEEPEKALAEIKRVSKKYLLLTVPNEPWFTYQRILRGKNLFQFGAHPEHIQHWTVGKFKRFIKGNGLKIRKTRLPFAWTMVLAEK